MRHSLLYSWQRRMVLRYTEVPDNLGGERRRILDAHTGIAPTLRVFDVLLGVLCVLRFSTPIVTENASVAVRPSVRPSVRPQYLAKRQNQVRRWTTRIAMPTIRPRPGLLYIHRQRVRVFVCVEA